MRTPRLVLAAVAILLAGCSSTSDPQTGGTAATTPTTPATADTAPQPTTLAPETTEASPARAIDRVRAPEASTVDDLLALDRPVVIAHAGGDLDAPHSTMYAFTEAALAGVDVLELDLMLTGDGVLIVHHDDTVDRTTNATGRVQDFTLAELQALDNAYWFAGVWSDQSLPDDSYALRGIRTGERPAPEGYGPDDFRIETFRAVAEAFPDHVLDVELKVPGGDLELAFEAAAVLAREIDELDRTDSIVVVSFSDDVIARFRELAPNVATSPGLNTLVAWYTGGDVSFAAQDRVFQAPPIYEGIEVLTDETFERARADGFPVWVWMSSSDQETADFYREMVSRGAAGLIVARPAEAVGAVGDG